MAFGWKFLTRYHTIEDCPPVDYVTVIQQNKTMLVNWEEVANALSYEL